MRNLFDTRAPSLNGPATDLVPITPSDSVDLPAVAIALYIEGNGAITFISEQGATRSAIVGDLMFLPVGVRRVLATGTTATGIHAMVVG